MAHAADGDPHHASPRPTNGNERQLAEWMVRRALVVSDVLTVGAAWLGVLAVVLVRNGPDASITEVLGWSATATFITICALSREKLYLTRVWAIRAVEVQRVGRAGLIAGLIMLALDAVAAGPLTPRAVLLAASIGSALVVSCRVAFEGWVAGTSSNERPRTLLLTGDVEAGRRVLDALLSRPGSGYRVAGLISAGRPARVAPPLPVPWVGTLDDLGLLLQLTAATAVTVVGNTLEPRQLARVLREVKTLDVHADLVTLGDDDALQFRALPLSHRGMVGDEPRLSTPQRMGKRAFDLIGGAALALFAFPVVMIAAVMLKIATGGPAFVQDVRLGPRGETVVVRRLRTRRLPDTPLAQCVGEVSRRLCIDELPQLSNVLGGSMTLVGPRPRPRGRPVTPVDLSAGLISLRHVETADSRAFGLQRRTDEFYVENWSVGLDLSIIAASVSDLAWRTVRRIVLGHHREAAAV